MQPGFGGLLGDLHSGLYKPDPHLVPEAEVPAEVGWQRAAVQRCWETKEWAQTREASVLDEVLSALGTLAAGEAALSELEKQADAPPPAVPGAAGGSTQTGEAPGVGQPAPGQRPGDQKTPKQVRSLSRAIRDAAKQEVTSTQQAMAAWGIAAGDLQRLPLGQRIELARRLIREPKLCDMAEVVGAMRALGAGLHLRRVTAKPAEVVGVTPGRDVTRLLPSELALLAHPVLRYEGVRRLVSGEALMWEKAARERRGRGPMIVLCDTSGSTEGRQEVLIKGIALGLLEIARRQKRGFAGVVFSSAGELQSFEFPAGKVEPEALLGFATTFYGGGTDWESPLREALRLQALSPFRQGDVVLITDGLCALPAAFTAELMAEKAKRDLRVLGVLSQAGAHSGAALGFCDQVIVTGDLNAAATEILGGVVEDR